MGGSSSQVVGYRYYASFLAFIGNRIENFIGINFDKRGWHTGRRVSMGDNGEMAYLHLPDLYGENEGGISGTLCVKYGSNMQAPDAAYKKYMESISSFASAYPYQSYISFTGSELLSRLNSLTEEQLQDLADQYNDGIVPGQGFYLGNSGYMKEMLLWVKRTRVRNDGREQWYEIRGDGAIVCEIDARSISTTGGTPPETVRLITEAKTYSKPIGENSFYDDQILNTSGSLLFEVAGAYVSGFADGEDFEVSLKHTVSVGGLKVSGIVSAAAGSHISSNHSLTFIENVGDTDRYSFSFFTDENSYTIGLTGGLKQGSFSGLLSIDLVRCIYDPRGDSSNEFTDINPIHKIREVLTDGTAMGKPETDINDANFMKAADRVWDDGLGVSWAIDEKSCVEAIEELCYHIEAGVRVNRQTGLYEMVLFRDDWFEENEIHTIVENKIKDLSLEVMNSDDIVNQLNVTYYDRERIKNSTFSIYENGSILTMGHANAESVEFPYFMNMRNAEIVANWKLKQFSTPAWSGSFTTGWREARKWNRYDLIRLPWSKKWNGTILVRIMKINLGNGTDNTVTIDFEEVIPYSGEMNTSIVVDAPIDSTPQPPQPSMNAVFEAPYYLTVLRAGQTNTDLELSNNPDIGYVAAIAAKPQSNSLNALLFTDGGMGEFEQVSRLDYCDILQLDQPIHETASTFVVTGSLTQTANSNNFILLNDELMGFVSFDDATKVLTVKRGVLDTVPKKHSSGSLFVFDLPDVAFDPTQYSQSEVVEVQVLTTTPSGIQEFSESGMLVEIHSRAIRPYPPANVKINGEYWPSRIVGDLSVTWVDRNRIQQTGGNILGWFDSGVTIETGVQYSLKIIGIDSSDIETTIFDGVVSGNNYSLPAEGVDESVSHIRIEIKSVRGEYDSYQKYIHTIKVLKPFSAPYNVKAKYYE